MEAEIYKRYEAMRRQGRPPAFALIAGVEYTPEREVPIDIVFETDPDDLVTSAGDFHILYVSEVRSDPRRALEGDSVTSDGNPLNVTRIMATAAEILEGAGFKPVLSSAIGNWSANSARVFEDRYRHRLCRCL